MGNYTCVVHLSKHRCLMCYPIIYAVTTVVFPSEYCTHFSTYGETRLGGAPGVSLNVRVNEFAHYYRLCMYVHVSVVGAKSRQGPVSTQSICSPPVFPDGCCRPESTVCRTGGNYNCAHWPVSKKPVSTKPIFRTHVSLPLRTSRKTV